MTKMTIGQMIDELEQYPTEWRCQFGPLDLRWDTTEYREVTVGFGWSSETRIQAAEAKRARKAAKRRRDANLTALGMLKARYAYDRAMVALTEARNACS